ncbi:MAG: glutamine synthetase family protein [Lachnospiraceae bacterium]|nr:glutamine synthetase family protein [Lachnospiraceae bacterium]
MKKELTREDVTGQVKAQDVEFIRLQFTDLRGHLKNMAITASQLEKALDNSFMFDGYSIGGFSAIEKADMYLYPDFSSFEIFPWRPQHGKVARLLCDVYTHDGKPFSDDPRYILKKAIAKAAEKGYTFCIEPECEFFLFHTDENGLPTTTTHEKAGYLDLGPLDLGENARRDIVLTLEQMGFEVIASHHETAPAQHEVDFARGEALEAADNIMTFKMVVRTIAKRHGLHATFMPKPKADVSGSGMHLKMMLLKDGKNVFESDSDPLGLSEEGYCFIGGILSHIRGISALTNPIVNSYKRLMPGFDAPVYADFEIDPLDCPLIRIPSRRNADTCIEMRSPDSAANPYLAIAAILTAGLEGMEKKIKASKDQADVSLLPKSLWEAIDAMEKDQLILDVLGDSCAKKYIAAKRAEAEEYDKQVTEWELAQYLYRY